MPPMMAAVGMTVLPVTTTFVDGDAFLDVEPHAAVRGDRDVAHVARADVAELVVVRVDLRDVVAQRIGVEHRADGRVHERAEDVGGDVAVAGERDLRDDRIFDDDVVERNAARRRPDVGLDVGEKSEREDGRAVGRDLLLIERRAGLRADHRGDPIDGDVRVAADVDGCDQRLRRRREALRSGHECEDGGEKRGACKSEDECQG